MPNNDIIELKNWIMYPLKNKLSLAGIANNHPKLGRNIEIANTSAILSIEENKSFVMTCRTLNSVYKLSWKDANLDPRESLQDPTTLNCAETVRDKYILYTKLIRARYKELDELNIALRTYMNVITEGQKQYKEYIELQNKELINKASKYNKCIYMEVSSISKGNTIAFNIDGKTGVINPNGTGGYYVDAIEYKTENNQGIDVSLGYFVGKDCIDIHTISKNVDNLVIHNNRRADLVVNGSYQVRFDETIIIETSKIRG